MEKKQKDPLKLIHPEGVGRMDITDEAIKTMKEIQDIYFTSGDMQRLFPYLGKDMIWFGADGERMDLKKGVAHYLNGVREVPAGRVTVTDSDYEAERISDTCCFVFGRAFLKEADCERTITVRVSALMKKGERGVELSRVHMSAPDGELKALLEERTAQVEERTNELKILSDTVPGGVIRFCCDKNMTITYANYGFYKMLGYEPEEVEKDFGNCFWELLHPEDRAGILQNWKEQLDYGDRVKAEFRVRRHNGSYLWILFNGKLIIELNNKRIFFGVLVDINKEREQQQILKEQAQMDPLTGVYNKLMAHYEVEDYLSSGSKESQGAFLMIDIDNFKEVNDTFGHMYGDVVLEDIAEALKAQFRTTDIIGRFGGDEFIVFMKDIAGREAALEKADRCNKALNRLSPGGNTACKISCSIGIAFAPENGRNFQELYGKADKALYRAKRKGKNRYAVYHDGIWNQNYSMLRQTEDTEIGTGNAGEEKEDFGLEKMIFNLLYEAGDISKAIEAIIKIIGQYFDVSRVYIFEDSGDGRRSVNTFEWCGEGIESQKEKLPGTAYEGGLEDYHLNFNEDGVFFCRDIHVLPAALRNYFEARKSCSFVQCAIMDNGVFRGFVGFDECRKFRCWSRRHIETLSFFSKTLGIFLIKEKRNREKEGNR